MTFEEASTALEDALSLTGDDPDHSIVEARLITFGVSSAGRLLTVSHTERGERIRIISARPATRAERKFYEEG
ncbi:MAG TPA: BrnT family toxin [Caldilineaceae bacterium]|nr:BrnT family toxin [Caldilineaceae bacterium]